MGNRTLIGVTRPDSRYTARWLQRGGHPDHLIPQLRRIWRETFRRDTAAMALSLLRHDWSRLRAEEDLRPDPNLVTVPGVGYAYPDSADREPWRGDPRRDSVRPDLEWLCLIDPTAGTICVYEATVHRTWLWHSGHRLDDVASPTEPAAPSRWTQTLAAARNAGEVAGYNAAAWWAQDAVGGRSSGDVTATARHVCAGIDDGDPAVLDALPTCDLPDGPDTEPESYQEIAPAGDVAGIGHLAWRDLDDGQRAQVRDAYRDGFDTALQHHVVGECLAALGDARADRFRSPTPMGNGGER